MRCPPEVGIGESRHSPRPTLILPPVFPTSRRRSATPMVVNTMCTRGSVCLSSMCRRTRSTFHKDVVFSWPRRPSHARDFPPLTCNTGGGAGGSCSGHVKVRPCTKIGSFGALSYKSMRWICVPRHPFNLIFVAASEDHRPPKDQVAQVMVL